MANAIYGTAIVNGIPGTFTATGIPGTNGAIRTEGAKADTESKQSDFTDSSGNIATTVITERLRKLTIDWTPIGGASTYNTTAVAAASAILPAPLDWVAVSAFVETWLNGNWNYIDGDMKEGADPVAFTINLEQYWATTGAAYSALTLCT
jgi:hypothetical protein